jgi:hypothetical protein
VQEMIPRINITAIRGASHQIHALIHPTALTVVQWLQLTLMRTSKRVPLHPVRRTLPGFFC